MDTESSTKFIGSLTKFLQSLCNGYVEFDDGVELIGHIYLSVDAGKTGKTLNYFLNEKVCKNDNSVTFISNSFHAQAEKSKEKDGENRKADDDIPDSGDNVPRSTNAGTMPFRPQGSRSGASPNQHRMGMPVGTKRPGSPLKGPPSQRRAPTPPSQRRFQSSGSRGAVGGSPVSKTVPSSPSSSSQDNAPSPSPARRSREISQPTSNQSDNVGADNENDIPPNVLSINPTPEFASFLGSLTSDNQTSQDQHSPPDTKPDTDVTFIKEEYVSEPTSCAQSGSSGQHSGRSGEDSSGLYPVMLHQNPSVFPGSSGYSNYQGGASSTATSQQPAFPGSSQSDFSPVPGTSQDGADPSGSALSPGTSSSSSLWRPGLKSFPISWLSRRPVALSSSLLAQSVGRAAEPGGKEHASRTADGWYVCRSCGKSFAYSHNMVRHRRKCEGIYHLQCQLCGQQFNRKDVFRAHVRTKHREEAEALENN